MNRARFPAGLVVTLVVFAIGSAEAHGVPRSLLTHTVTAQLRPERIWLSDPIELPRNGGLEQLLPQDTRDRRETRSPVDVETAPGDDAFRGAERGETEAAHELFNLIGQVQLTTGTVLVALLLAFGLGALHAVSPGHGKTLVAAYLVGSRGTVLHAVALGSIVTFTHVFSVLILGVVALVAADHLVPEKLAPILGLISGLLIVGVGIFMFRRVFRGGYGHLDSEEAHAHPHSGGDPQARSCDPRGLPSGGEVTPGSLVALGVSGGMVPCPSAMVVLLTAIALRRIALGLALVVMFSLGLAVVLIAIGVLLVTAKGFTERFAGDRWLKRAAVILPVVSATVITTVGVLILWHSFVDASRTPL